MTAPAVTGAPSLRAVAVDLDDTLLRGDKSIAPRTLAAWERCRARGVALIVATARAEKPAAPFLAVLRPDAVVSNSGALARVGARTVFFRTFAPGTADGIARACAAADCGIVTAETEDGYFWNSHGAPTSAEYGHAIYTDFQRPLPPCFKLTAEIADAALAESIAARFPDCTLTEYYGQSWKRFSPAGVDKGAGLSAALAALGIAAAETAAFGDDYSDERMLASVGWGIAMGNAVAEVKAAARETTDDNGHDGVARWLETRFLDPVTVRPAGPGDAALLYELQRRTFLPLLEKYRDEQVNPAAESYEMFCAKLARTGTDPYVILRSGLPVGGVRILHRAGGMHKVSALGIAPDCQNAGAAQTALRLIEALHPDARGWMLDTIAEEKGNCHLYEKLGYVRVGAPRRINERLTLVDYQKGGGPAGEGRL